MHPLLQLLVTRPDLLAEHAEAYAELTGIEIRDLVADGYRQVLLGAVALCCATVSMVLTGVALLLVLALPEARNAAWWTLVLPPGVPLLVALASYQRLRARPKTPAFATLREQLSADWQLLQKVKAS